MPCSPAAASTAAAPSRRWLTPLLHVWGVAYLRRMFLALLLHGLAAGTTTPLLALWLTRQGASPLEVSLYFAVVAVAGMVVNPLLGHLSDRRGSRQGSLAWAGLLQVGGFAAFALGPPLPVIFVVGALFLSAMMQGPFFAALDDYLSVHPVPVGRSAVVSTERMAISLAWGLGAPLGGLLAAYGYTFPFVLAAVANLASLALGLSCLAAVPPRHASPASSDLRHPTRPRWPQLVLYAAAISLILGANMAKIQFIPLYLHRGLHASPAQVGVTFSVMAWLEVLFMPVAGQIADRAGGRRVVLLGAVAAALFFSGQILARSWLAVTSLMPLVAFMAAAVMGVGIRYGQELDPAHVGLATGMYFAGQIAASVVGGPAIAWFIPRLGLPHAFAVSAVLALLGAFLLLLTRPAGREPVLS